SPISFGALVGDNCSEFFDPVRKTPMHDWAADNGAVFEDVGQWKRARYYPRMGEGLDQAVQREAKAVRANCGLLDASTLGKIDVQGPDAAEFLNRIYTNAYTNLGVGRCRYGLMLDENGMVFDDGVVARLGDKHFHLTTTTGGAARVYAWLERWLQTEWQNLKVFCTSVTEQWATMTVSGPAARSVVSMVVDPNQIGPVELPHMGVVSTDIAGVPGRIFRISFTGEISFELNVPADYGAHVWDTVIEAGKHHNLVLYGTETMHLLRAEKGFIIVGQETDGSVTPQDLGMDWIVSKKKYDFIGLRSLSRRNMMRPDRRQLVGLETDDPSITLEEGVHVVEDAPVAPQTPMLGHVTSSYFSPNLGRSIALGLLKGGKSLAGRQLFALSLEGEPISLRVVGPCFLDPEGSRLHG
ncbi:MAG: glycine cleavage T C-terminal barrel domain-containing protein, partial [Pseudomonadota bacterium]